VFRYPNPIQKPLAANRCLLAVQRPSVRPESGPDAGDIREVRQLREWILILRDRVVAKDDPAGPELRRSVEIPKGSVGHIMDFTDPIIRGVSLFHCHLLSHEDKGMMAKIAFK